MRTLALALALSGFLPPTSHPTPTIEPGDAVVVSGKLGKELDVYLTRCELFGFSGVALVAKKGKVLLRKGYGLARPEEGVPNTPETLYDIASASKQVAATAILKLEAEGKLSTDDSIAEHLADVPEEHRGITVLHLLQHTSGFPRAARPGGGPDRDAAVAAYLRAKRTAEPGKRHEYWNGGYALLAAIVERVSGEDYEEWVHENLFRPAKLEHSGLMDSFDTDDPKLARTHDGGKLTTDYIRGWGYRGMGGMITSVSDLYRWMRALKEGDVLPKKALEKLWDPGPGNYACGWYVTRTDKGREVIAHGGTAPGFQSYIRWFPKEDVLVLVTCNREGMHWQVTWGLCAVMLDEDAQVPPPPEVESWKEKEFDALSGRYRHEKHGSLVVERDGGALRIGAEGSGAIAVLSGDAPPRGEAPFAWERSRAAEIIAGLLAGDVEPMERDLMSHLPSSWPRRVLTNIWPEHLEEHGKVGSFEEVGAVEDARSGRVRVWVRLRHEDAESTVEVAFTNRELNIFSLKPKPFPVERAYAPVGKNRFLTYAFSADELPEIEIETGKRKQATLTIEAGRKKLKFERESR